MISLECWRPVRTEEAEFMILGPPLHGLWAGAQVQEEGAMCGSQRRPFLQRLHCHLQGNSTTVAIYNDHDGKGAPYSCVEPNVCNQRLSFGGNLQSESPRDWMSDTVYPPQSSKLFSKWKNIRFFSTVDSWVHFQTFLICIYLWKEIYYCTDKWCTVYNTKI